MPSEQTPSSRPSVMYSSPRETVLASWVHVSDLHFGHGDAGHQWNQRRVLDELLVDAKALVLDGMAPRPDFVFVTGDIAFSGGARTPAVGEAEYALASHWFRQFQEVLEIPSERVFMVPGNHDVDRRAEADVRRLLKLVRAGEETLDEVLQAPVELDRLRGRMARYLAFAQGFGPPASERFHDGLWWRQRIELAEGVSLRVCGLNTALLSLDDEDQGKLRIGQRQLAELFVPAPSGLELALVLGHHPTTGRWLPDEKELRGQLDRHAALCLFGHLHEADSEQARHGWGTGCLRIAAGAAHAEAASVGAPPVGHGYNFGALVVLGTGDLVVRLWPRRWSTRSPRFVPDVDNTLDRCDHAEHRLPEKYRIHRPAPTRGLHSGEILGGRYRLIAKSGQGGVGEVWRALDLERDGTVAVKVLNPEEAEPDAGRRAGFFRGAQAMAGLHHPAIVRVRDPRPDPNNKHGPYDFYVMDFIDAPSLGAAFKGAPRSDEETIEILLAIGEGVAAAHRQRVIHRDLKPSNILRDPASGRVFIIDFDTAKDLANLTMTRSGDGLASTLYASPEVLMSLNPPRGSKAPTVDVRADIFSLAVIGIFLRTGRDPSHYYINRMSELVPAIECAAGLREVLAKGCAHAAADRFASVDDLLLALRRLQFAEEAPTTVSGPPGSIPQSAADARQPSLPPPSQQGPGAGDGSGVGVGDGGYGADSVDGSGDGVFGASNRGILGESPDAREPNFGATPASAESWAERLLAALSRCEVGHPLPDDLVDVLASALQKLDEIELFSKELERSSELTDPALLALVRTFEGKFEVLERASRDLPALHDSLWLLAAFFCLYAPDVRERLEPLVVSHRDALSREYMLQPSPARALRALRLHNVLPKPGHRMIALIPGQELAGDPLAWTDDHCELARVAATILTCMRRYDEARQLYLRLARRSDLRAIDLYRLGKSEYYHTGDELKYERKAPGYYLLRAYRLNPTISALRSLLETVLRSNCMELEATRVAYGLPLPAEFAPFPAPDVAEPDAASRSASSEPVSRSSGGHTPREPSQAPAAAAVAAPSSSPHTPAATLAPAATDALLEPPWPSLRAPQAEPAELVVDPVDIDFKPALRLPSWWMLVPVAVAIAFWAVVLTDRTPESLPVAISFGSILVESGFEEQRVREVAESHLDDVRECYTRLRTRLEAPVHIPLHLVVQPSGIVGSAGMKYGVAERPDLADCVVEKATHWKFPRPSIPHFVGVTIHIELSPSDRSRPTAS